MKIHIILVFAFFISSLSFSQKSDTGNWFIYFGNQNINQKWNWHNEIQNRNFNFIGDTNQLLLRTGIGCNLTKKNNNILLGYGFINTQKYLPNSDQKTDFNEHRIFQQFINRPSYNRFFLQHRFRLEERFLPNDFQMRVRYLLGINIPINKKSIEKIRFIFLVITKFLSTPKNQFLIETDFMEPSDMRVTKTSKSKSDLWHKRSKNPIEINFK